MGDFHLTKTFEKLVTEANGTEISRDFTAEFPKCKTFNRKFWKFQEQSGMERKLPGKNFSKIWVYLARLTSLTEILENVVPFATGSCRKFKADVLVEWKASND